MKNGTTFSENQEAKQLSVTVDPLLYDGVLEPASFCEAVIDAGFKNYYIMPSAIDELAEIVNSAKSNGEMDTITMVIGEVRNAEVSLKVSDDQMTATMSIIAPHNGVLPTIEKLYEECGFLGVCRGLSKKRLQSLIESAHEAEPGTVIESVIAQGLPPKKGKDSYIFPLVPNALDRILAPQAKEDGKVDMRNLGEILCVDAEHPIAKRKSPSKGRDGFTVTNTPLTAQAGEWKDIKLGKNTHISEHDNNLIVASVAGQPKFEDGRMNIDDTFVSPGVNVKTGNINYNGAVIVNGDVTEQMQIIAEGDITINGFVESALIRAGGDIIITQGATGKMDDVDCQIYANGSIFIQHGQGLDIIAGKDLTVGKQLAYSRVKTKGKIFVGRGKIADGNLFASQISAGGLVQAGSVGAISGSTLEIDYSEGYNLICSRLESISELLSTLRSSNADHEVKMSKIPVRTLPKFLVNKLNELNNAIEKERLLLHWMTKVEQDLQENKAIFEKNARVVANKELYPGVNIRLNKRVWRAEQEYNASRVTFNEGNWKHAYIT